MDWKKAVKHVAELAVFHSVWEFLKLLAESLIFPTLSSLIMFFYKLLTGSGSPEALNSALATFTTLLMLILVVWCFVVLIFREWHRLSASPESATVLPQSHVHVALGSVAASGLGTVGSQGNNELTEAEKKFLFGKWTVRNAKSDYLSVWEFSPSGSVIEQREGRVPSKGHWEVEPTCVHIVWDTFQSDQRIEHCWDNLNRPIDQSPPVKGDNWTNIHNCVLATRLP
jgi:hypothetical protein